MIDLLNVAISGTLAIVGAVAAQLIFFRQNRKKLQNENTAAELENKSKQAEEWRKLYEEELAENRKKDELISRLYKQVDDCRNKRGEVEVLLSKEKARNAHLSVLKCLHYDCPNRRPPFEEVARKIETEEAESDNNEPKDQEP